MGHRLLARLLWPMGMALQTSIVVVAGWYDPDSVRRVMGLTTVGFLLALLGLEQALPYRVACAARLPNAPRESSASHVSAEA
jgi:hypothetical protein